MPPIITGRRPIASDSGPCTSDANANGSMYAVMTCCSCQAPTFSAFSIAWNAGKNVSMEKGLTIDNPPISTASIVYPGSLCCKGLSTRPQRPQKRRGILSAFQYFHERGADDDAGHVPLELLHLFAPADAETGAHGNLRGGTHRVQITSDVAGHGGRAAGGARHRHRVDEALGCRAQFREALRARHGRHHLDQCDAMIRESGSEVFTFVEWQVRDDEAADARLGAGARQLLVAEREQRI